MADKEKPMKRMLVVSMLLLGCASLPPTDLPICSESFEIACRAAESGEVSGYESPKANLCPWPPGPGNTQPPLKPLDEEHPNTGACYLHAGVRDSREVYEYRAFAIRKETDGR